MEWREEMRIANLFTLLNLVAGFLAIVFAENALLASGLIFSAVVFDFLDGRAARMAKQAPSAFGKELDSLADVVSFGVAPAVFGYVQIVAVSAYPSLLAFSLVILTIFVVCGMLRLARFNVTNIKGFEGIPITTNGILFPLLYIVGVSPLYWTGFYAASAFLMVSKFKVKKL
ncbi:CDP-diacylglycerol--serine O-phosphatidyltransferase [Candidatus Woesearchaeota archaeon]|nr:CDP-diacylglycerol--serine O-phosphatidyltransferase [Candidatus Woesearchaeota archaeon]